MSQRPNESPVRSPTSPANGRPQDRSISTTSPLPLSDGGSFRQNTPRMSDGRASGELEGSTLGSISLERDQRTPGHRATRSSSGFLLDSLPRPRSTRPILHRPQPSESAKEKRNVPEPDINVHKKRSRLPWKRHKQKLSELDLKDASQASISAPQASTPPRGQPSGSSSQPEVPESNVDVQPSTAALDRDSIQIVNLALSLNESRRRTASGILPGSDSLRPISAVSKAAVPPAGNYAHTPRAGDFQRDSPYRNFTQAPGTRLSQGTLPNLERSSVVNLLPPSAVEGFRTFEISGSTLARVEKARNHFDLFYEYMRLLPSLPALPDAGKDGAEPKPWKSHRAYNPLQTIRNRKVRYRERSQLDADAEGWHDIERVHQWINAVEREYRHTEHDQVECLKLPPFNQAGRHVPNSEHEDADIMGASPPSSLRRVSRTNSMKTRRPRMEWKISPAELLADAVWLEDGTNKAKIVDKDGYKLYPDPTKLVIRKAQADFVTPQKQQTLVETEDSGEARSSPRTSLSSAHPALAHEFKSVRRGRHRHRFRSHSKSLHSRSASSKGKPTTWDKVKMRSGSVSSSSSSDSGGSIADKPRLSREHVREHVQRFVDHAHSRSHMPLTKSSTALSAEKDRGRAPQPSGLSRLDTQQSPKHRGGSFSSPGSPDYRPDPRMSMEGMDSTAPSSPTQVGYFPSIAVNLSPPSSRSPSPAKKGLRHKIASRHERSKSKQGDRDREGEDRLLEPGTLSRLGTTTSERMEGVSKLQPSPLPDVVSSPSRDNQATADETRPDEHRSRRAMHPPESKLRGIFKGPGRIAEIVGSKVGDRILKKDEDPGSRRSSPATPYASDDSDSDEDFKGEKKSSAKALLRRLPTLTDESGRLTRKDSGKNTSRTFKSSLPSFTSPLRQEARKEAPGGPGSGSSGERRSSTEKYDFREHPRKSLARSKTLDFSPSLQQGRRNRHEITDAAVPYSLTRPPVTGLANARASPGVSPDGTRGGLSGASRAWSISGRSLQSLADSGVPGKPEVERTRALLLSSGIKAREITRKAHTARDPPPHWLQNSMGPGQSVPYVTRINEWDLAAQTLLQRFESTQYSFQQSMHHFSTSTSLPLRSQLRNLEKLANDSLAPRVRATANDAQDLCVQLNSTSTLAVKQLGDALDKGIRKRRRRLRWIRRTGFMFLEWALVGMLWWVWLIVMAFKLVHGVFRGAFSGIRWVLWL